MFIVLNKNKIMYCSFVVVVFVCVCVLCSLYKIRKYEKDGYELESSANILLYMIEI